jgi:hypothetical protein
MTATTATTALTNQQVTVVFEALLGFPPRAADLAVLRAMHPDELAVEEVASYIWDHMLGEPDEPTLEQVEAAARDCMVEDQR